jgi:hypothetical protein
LAALLDANHASVFFRVPHAERRRRRLNRRGGNSRFFGKLFRRGRLFGTVRVASDVILSLASGAADVATTSVEADGPLLAAATGGCGAAAWATGAAVFAPAGSARGDLVIIATGFELLNKSEPERLGADIWRQDSLSQFFGASMRILCPPIWSETPLPAWAAVLAISKAARR